MEGLIDSERIGRDQIVSTGVTNMGLAIMFSQKTFFSLVFYQHSGPEIKLLLELRDEDMDRHEILLVRILHVPNNVSQPLKLLLVTGHPQEINLKFEHRTVDILPLKFEKKTLVQTDLQITFIKVSMQKFRGFEFN